MYDRSPVPVRALLALTATAAGLALLLNFKTPDTLALRGAANGAPSDVAQVAPAVSATALAPAIGTAPGATDPRPSQLGVAGRDGHRAGSGPAATSTPVATPAPSTGAPATDAPAVTPAPTRAPAGAVNADVTGPSVDTPFGAVQVEVKIQGGRIADVIAVQLPFDRRRSAMISQYVAPILHDEAVQAQTAQINLISGATYTSDAYAQSLQAALDQAHFKG